jgi:hypothetical protein
MIQRRQTLYLLIVVVLLALTMALPLGRFLAGDTELVFSAFSISETGGDKLMGNYPLVLLATLATLVPLVTIFFYKRRMVQLRLCFSEFVLLTGLQGFIAWYLLHANSGLEGAGEGDVMVAYSVPAIFPLVCIVFVWLALRGILKDEALVRSMDRIR